MADDTESREDVVESERDTADADVSEDTEEAGGAKNGENAADTGGTRDPSVPQVELSLYQLSVKVSGQATDELADVEESATRLMDYLIERTHRLEDKPDSRGLG